MSGSRNATLIKFGIFATVMVILTACMFAILGQYRTGSTNGYSAVFTDASRLRPGDSVRVAGIRVGTVNAVTLRDDKLVLVRFDADRDIVLTAGTKAAVRYLNLVGDRFLELVEGPGSTTVLPKGSQIPPDRTTPALDLDLLLGGLKPVIAGLNPTDVNALTTALIRIFQGEGGTLESLMAKTSSFSTTLADNNEVVQQLIDHLNTVLATLSKDGEKFSSTIDRLERLVTELAGERDPIGTAIDSLSAGTASLAQLLTSARPPLGAAVDQLSRLAPLLDDDKELLEAQIQKSPANYRKLVRLGAYGAFVHYYLCGVSLRITDRQDRTVIVPWLKQENGRCSEP